MVSSCCTAGAPGGQEEAVRESSSAGQREERQGAGQGVDLHHQEFGAHDRSGSRRRRRGHRRGERARPAAGRGGLRPRKPRGGLTEVSPQVPSPPGDEDEDFILVHHSDVQVSEKAEQVYGQLKEMLKEQYEVGQQEETRPAPTPSREQM